MKNRTTAGISYKQVIDAGMALCVIFLLLEIFLKTGYFYKIALALLLADMIFPKIFYPFAVAWFWLAGFMGKIMNFLIQSAVFYILVVPVGLIRKIRGKDTLQLKEFKKGPSSVMVTRDHLFHSPDIEKPY